MIKSTTIITPLQPVRIIPETLEEAQILENQFRAIGYYLGPFVELSAVLPDGSILHSPKGGKNPAAQCASLNERIEQTLKKRGWSTAEEG